MRLHSDLRARGALLLTLAALPFALAACGGSSSSSSTTSSANAADTARIKFAQCMRSNGVNIPDPGTTGAGGGGGGFRQALRGIDRTKLQAAQKACAKFRTGAFGNITPAQRQAFRDAFTKFAACMRSHGVDLPDPGTFGPGGGGPGGGGAAAGANRPRIDRNDPAVQAAQKACQSNLPQGGRGGFFFRGGPGAGGGGVGAAAPAGQAQ